MTRCQQCPKVVDSYWPCGYGSKLNRNLFTCFHVRWFHRICSTGANNRTKSHKASMCFCLGDPLVGGFKPNPKQNPPFRGAQPRKRRATRMLAAIFSSGLGIALRSSSSRTELQAVSKLVRSARKSWKVPARIRCGRFWGE